MDTNANQLVMLVQLKEEFQLMLQLGKATGKYLEQYGRLLAGMGIDNRIVTDARPVITDSNEQVL